MAEETEVTSTETTYTIVSSSLTIRDGDDMMITEERLKYHVETGDCFNMIATVLGFLEESLRQHGEKNPELETKEVEAARALRERLQFLNQHYCIKPKD